MNSSLPPERPPARDGYDVPQAAVARVRRLVDALIEAPIDAAVYAQLREFLEEADAAVRAYEELLRRHIADLDVTSLQGPGHRVERLP